MVLSLPRQERVQVRLPAHPSSVAEARRLVRSLLEGRDPDLLDSCVLVVSEVVTNALLHAGTEVDLTLSTAAGEVLLEVGDGSPHLPARRRYATTAGTGRGLAMVESLVDDWGVNRHPRGKTVWFRLSADELSDPGTGAAPSTFAEVAAADARPSPGVDVVPVELLNMPLLLHLAWQEHAETLLREYLLASLESDLTDPIRVHADATDAIALLEEHVPRLEEPFVGNHLMRDPVEPLVSAERVDVPVPVDSVGHFSVLDSAIDAALALVGEGRGLTPVTQPEVQAFRRWVCRQVEQQANGGAPQAWVLPEDADLPSGPAPATTTLLGVRAASAAVVAATVSGQIVAVSVPAADLLGYDDPDELTGSRLLSIIPVRLRQAHLAGLSLFRLTGRRAILDRPVTVPALRRDGIEVEVTLTVREQDPGSEAPAEPALLVAELRTEADRVDGAVGGPG